MRCYYHDDMDGRAAAAVVALFVGGDPGQPGVRSEDLVLKPAVYGQPLDTEGIRQGEEVWIVDFALSPAECRAIRAAGGRVVWIDHHATAIRAFEEAVKDDLEPPEGIRDPNEAACVLTWKYVRWRTMDGRADFGEAKANDVFEDRVTKYPIPEALRLIADRDTWRWEFGERTAEFHAGLLSMPTDPRTSEGFNTWQLVLLRAPEVLADPCRGIIQDGQIIERYRRQQARDYTQAMAYEVVYTGLRVLAMNVARAGSEAFAVGDRPALETYDILAAFHWNGKTWAVSLYSAHVDVSEIAKQQGGGGHVNAAAFTCNRLPVWLRIPVPYPTAAIARACHEALREYDAARGEMPLPPWEEAPTWMRETTVGGVTYLLSYPEAGPQALYDSWWAERITAAETHLVPVPFADLPAKEQAKDRIFTAIVRALAQA